MNHISKFNTFSFEKELKEYCAGKVKYTSNMNIFINDRTKDWYYEIGKYLIKAFDGYIPKSLSFFRELGIENSKLKKKDETTLYHSVGIFFLTSTLNDEVLEVLFGPPLYHDEFGEGMGREYDENDEPIEPEMKFTYASYFVEIEGVKLHIGYDHRGTSIEFIRDISCVKAFGCIKKLIDMCVELQYEPRPVI